AGEELDRDWERARARLVRDGALADDPELGVDAWGAAFAPDPRAASGPWQLVSTTLLARAAGDR
ncbi:MAG: hypothetical protein HZA53_11900, partial [Planctomycetes bacterium]|nr:hypothetical protein [Planctomycetota bacterium]